MKRIFCLFFGIVFIVASFIPLCTYAGVKTNEYDAGIQDVGTELQSNFDIETVLYDSLINCEKQIDLTSFSIDAGEINNLALDYYNFLYNNPDLFYVSTGFSYATNSLTNKIVYIIPNYTMTENEISQARLIYESGIRKALRLVDDTMSDLQKALVIHDYICNTASYPKLIYDGSTLTNDSPLFHSAYGFFSNAKVVCEGYTNAYTAILKRLGIEAKMVSSSTMNHAWNVVKINGNWYNADLTFDDPVMDSDNYSSFYGIFNHTYFLKSNDYFTNSAPTKHTGIVYPENVQCNDTSYDDYFWNNIIGYVGVHDGDYYYMDCNTSTQGLVDIDILKRDLKGNTERMNTDAYKALCSKIGDITRPNAQLVPYEGKLYFSCTRFSGSNIVSEIYVINYDKTYYKFDQISGSGITVYFALSIVNGDLGYLSYTDLTNNKFTYNVFSRSERFPELYKNSSYDAYVDVNNDGVINAKDYAYIAHNDFLC